MSRIKRFLQRTFAIYCEGDTEYNYIDAMRGRQGVKLSIKPVNMHGGGYKNFLNEVRTGIRNNYLAKFIIVDLDRLHKHPEERQYLTDLIEYCKIQNGKEGGIPHFLIIDNPDFEYLACLHIPSYSTQNTKRFIEKTLSFVNIERFKSKKDVYEYLNSRGNSYTNMLSRLNPSKFLCNDFLIKKSKMEIVLRETIVDWDRTHIKTSNINELFQIIDW